MTCILTSVGDRNIYSAMKEYNALLGGESSGHIIFRDLCASSDGLVTALMILRLLQDDNSISRLLIFFNKKKQYQKSVEYTPDFFDNMQKLDDFCHYCSKKFTTSHCRCYIRFSGTEPVIRVMVEFDHDLHDTGNYIDTVCQFITENIRRL